MSATTDRVPDKSGPVRRRHFLLLLAVVTVAALAGVGAWRLLRPSATPREPPAVPLDGVEPGVAKAIEARLARVRAEPGSGPAWGSLGVVLTAHNFRTAADSCFAEAESLDPNEPSWPYLHARTLLQANPTDERAAELLARSAELCGTESDAPRLQLAEFLLARGRLDEAERQFRLLLERDPDHARARLGLARAAAARDDPKVALDQLRSCADSPFTRKAALQLTAEVRQALGDRDAARAALAEAAAAPDDAPWPDAFLETVEEAKADRASRFGLATQAQREGRADRAEELIGELRRDYPEYADMADCRSLLNRKDWAAAELAARRAVQQAPDSAEAQFLLGAALLGRDDAEGAAACFRRTLRLQPDHAEAYDRLGQALALRGDRAGAIEALRAAVRYLPQQAGPRRRLGELLAQEGHDAEALEHLRRALTVRVRATIRWTMTLRCHHTSLKRQRRKTRSFAGASGLYPSPDLTKLLPRGS